MKNAPLHRRYPLSQHTIGPFFPPNFFQAADHDLTRVSEDADPTKNGESIAITGLVMKEGRIPISNAILEIWQADASGRFRHPLDPESEKADPDFLGWGRARTNVEGAFSFRSILPGSYEEDGRRRAPHLNIQIMAAGLMRPVGTTLYFPDFPDLNAEDPVLGLVPEELRQRLVMGSGKSEDGIKTYSFDFLLRGPVDEETPFFET